MDEVDVERVALAISLQISSSGNTAPERLAMLLPFAPASETWARIVALSENCTKCAVSLHAYFWAMAIQADVAEFGR